MNVFDLNIMLPFFFVLAIVYGALEVSGVFKNKGVKGIIALVIAFFSVSSPAVVEIINSLLPYAALFFIVFFFLGFAVSALKGKDKERKIDFGLLVAVLALVLIFLSNQQNIGIINIQDQNFIGMLVLLVIAAIVYAAYKKE